MRCLSRSQKKEEKKEEPEEPTVLWLLYPPVVAINLSLCVSAYDGGKEKRK